jgi:hypothetical protein
MTSAGPAIGMFFLPARRTLKPSVETAMLRR